jgi:hypothetical protein
MIVALPINHDAFSGWIQAEYAETRGLNVIETSDRMTGEEKSTRKSRSNLCGVEVCSEILGTAGPIPETHFQIPRAGQIKGGNEKWEKGEVDLDGRWSFAVNAGEAFA